jgi:hypothetical protein
VKIILTGILFFLFINNCLSQKIEIYTQEKTVLFWNEYQFTWIDSISKTGRFEHTAGADDGQQWYGKGAFKQIADKYILNFIQIKDSILIKESSGSNLDTLYIKYFELAGSGPLFTVEYTNSDKKLNQEFDYESYTAKIPKKELQSHCLLIKNAEQTTDFQVPDNVPDSVVMIAINQKRMHFDSPKELIFRKKGNFLIGRGNFFEKKEVWYKLRSSK